MSGTPAFGPVIKAMRDLATRGQHVVTVSELGEILGREPSSVSNAINHNIRQCNKAGTTPAFVRVQRGAYRLAVPGDRSTAAATDDTDTMFELVGHGKTGAFLIKGDVTGMLYVAKPAEF